MTLYFKTKYKPFYEEWKEQKDCDSVIPSLNNLIKDEFPDLFACLGEKAKFELVELIKLLVFSHRHNKNDKYLQDPLIPFQIIRDPMYMYSRNAQNKFFDYSTFSFLFAWFESNPQAKNFALEKFKENKDPQHPNRMIAEITQLGAEAEGKLQSQQQTPCISSGLMSQQAAVQMRRSLNKYLQNSKARWQQNGLSKLE